MPCSTNASDSCTRTSRIGVSLAPLTVKVALSEIEGGPHCQAAGRKPEDAGGPDPGDDDLNDKPGKASQTCKRSDPEADPAGDPRPAALWRRSGRPCHCSDRKIVN